MPPKAPPPKGKPKVEPSPPPSKASTGEDGATSPEFETPTRSAENSDTSTPRTVPLQQYNELVTRYNQLNKTIAKLRDRKVAVAFLHSLLMRLIVASDNVADAIFVSLTCAALQRLSFQLRLRGRLLFYFAFWYFQFVLLTNLCPDAPCYVRLSLIHISEPTRPY